MQNSGQFMLTIKLIRQAIVAIVFFALLACSAKVDQSQVYTRNGLIRLKATHELFSGYVKGKSREGYRLKRYAYLKQYKDGRLDGISKFFYDNGKLESVEPYKNGELDGTVIRYYENGQKKASFSIKNGMRGGRAAEFFWDENGKLIKG